MYLRAVPAANSSKADSDISGGASVAAAAEGGSLWVWLRGFLLLRDMGGCICELMGEWADLLLGMLHAVGLWTLLLNTPACGTCDSKAVDDRACKRLHACAQAED